MEWSIIGIIVIALVLIVVSAVLSSKIAAKKALEKKEAEDAMTIGTAELRARNIVKDAEKLADDKIREAKLEIKEEIFLFVLMKFLDQAYFLH